MPNGECDKLSCEAAGMPFVATVTVATCYIKFFKLIRKPFLF